jgi:hypothetical protein
MNDKKCQFEKGGKSKPSIFENPYPIQAAQYLQLNYTRDTLTDESFCTKAVNQCFVAP